ncbi:MAG TPA: hypothetical protein VFQ39_13515 [Longimicrobium sp.]|nr:hypothetical protein [Longimicrobium sp.]
MKFALLGALLITFPAVCAFIYGLISGHIWISIAAFVSLGLNTLPFLVAGFFLSKRHGGGDDLAH